ncbi:hypothetical protein GBA52_019226 [Prunus armeniaca]|nr:hypothetical protein GBA52_019226 [Prunus armeniaca]
MPSPSSSPTLINHIGPSYQPQSSKPPNPSTNHRLVRQLGPAKHRDSRVELNPPKPSWARTSSSFFAKNLVLGLTKL